MRRGMRGGGGAMVAVTAVLVVILTVNIDNNVLHGFKF